MLKINDRLPVPPLASRALPRLAALVVAAALTSGVLVGCGGMSGTSGDEGTVDLVKAQEIGANSPNEAIAKKAKFAGGMGSAPTKGKK